MIRNFLGAVMHQIRIRKQSSTVKRPQDIDTRTPSGRPLPY